MILKREEVKLVDIRYQIVLNEKRSKIDKKHDDSGARLVFYYTTGPVANKHLCTSGEIKNK